MAPLRVLHCPFLIGDQARQLARAERELGLDSWCVSFEPHRFGSRGDEVLWEHFDGPIRRQVARFTTVIRAMREFDVIHFNFGSTLMPNRLLAATAGGPGYRRLFMRIYAGLLDQRDMQLLKRSGKRIFVTFQGSDARPSTRPGSATENRVRRSRIAYFDRWADGLYALNPDLLRALPGRARFVPYAHVDPREWTETFTQSAGSHRPVVVHAPTNRQIKGTEHVLEAVNALEREGFPIDFRLIEGMEAAEARRQFMQADVAIDQLLIGWYGGFAVEMMALRKPVISFLRDEDLDLLPRDMQRDLPVISATPATIKQTLRDLLTRGSGQLAALGQRSRAYVERYHDPLRIAARLKADYENAPRP